MRLNQDIEDYRWLYAKGALFGVLGLLAGALLLMGAPNWRSGVLLVLTIWAFCRLYYFLFYVIERYIDPQFRFAGLGSVLAYLLKKRRSG